MLDIWFKSIKVILAGKLYMNITTTDLATSLRKVIQDFESNFVGSDTPTTTTIADITCSVELPLKNGQAS